jgi:hypothetical protein
MCDPSTALMVAGTATQFVGQQQQASSQNAMNRQRQELGTERALQNYRLQTSQAYKRMQQEREATGQEIREVARQSRRAQATGTVSAGEAGVTGKSVDAMLDDFERQELMYQTNIKRNQEWREDNTKDQLEAIRIGTQGRVEDLQFMPAQRPSFLGAALRIGGQVAGYYAAQPTFTDNLGGGLGGNATNPYNAGSDFNPDFLN